MFSAKKALDGGKKELKKHAALLKKDGGTAECDRWLQDNAALLMSCITNGIKSVGKHRGDSVNGVFRALSDCIDRTENGRRNTFVRKTNLQVFLKLVNVSFNKIFYITRNLEINWN